MLVTVRNRKTGELGETKSKTWEDGPDIPVWMNGTIYTWNQTDVQLVNDEHVPPPPPPPVIPPDPFELYTEQEFEDWYDSQTGYAITKEYVLKMLAFLHNLRYTVQRFLSFSPQRESGD